MTAAGVPATFPILSVIVFLPTAGAVFILLALKKEWQDGIRWSALAVSLATFFLSVGLLPAFDTNTAELQWVEKTAWIE